MTTGKKRQNEPEISGLDLIKESVRNKINKRIEIAKLLLEGKSYLEISDELLCSSITIADVSKRLQAKQIEDPKDINGLDLIKPEIKRQCLKREEIANLILEGCPYSVIETELSCSSLTISHTVKQLKALGVL